MKRIILFFILAATAFANLTGNYPTIAPSLLLDFAATKQLDPRISFDRASTARYYDGKTYVKAEENLLLYSQQFTNAVYTKPTVAVTDNAIAAPDGTTTAARLAEDTSTGGHGIYQGALIVSGASYTWSAYVKANGRTKLAFNCQATGTVYYSRYDLTAVTATTVSGSGTATITGVGSGWYRIVAVASATGGGTGYWQLDMLDASNSGTYTGDGTSGIYVWGAQLEQRSAATAYTATTTQPITRYQPALMTAHSGVARFDHNPVTGESLGLLLEEQRANFLTYSQDFSNAAWTKYVLSLGPSSIGPSGIAIAKLTPSAASAEHYINYQLSVTGNTAYTLSCYAKVGELSRVALRTVFSNGSMDSVSRFALTDGTFAKHENHSSASIVHVGNGWYRISITFTTPASIPSDFLVRIQPLADDGNVTFTGNGYTGIFAGDPQFEAGAFTTSYIPTTTAQATRGADTSSMTGANFSSWYRQDEGTWVVTNRYEGTSAHNSSNRGVLGVSSSSTEGYLVYNGQGEANRVYAVTRGNTIQIGSLASWSGYITVALALKYNDYAMSINGASSVSAALPIPFADKVVIGGTWSPGGGVLNGHIRRIAYYPTRMTNAQLQALSQNN